MEAKAQVESGAVEYGDSDEEHSREVRDGCTLYMPR